MSDADRLTRLRDRYRTELVADTLPFWLRHGLDRECGGLITGLAEDGAVIDTDKAVWLQGRAAWTFATAYLRVERESRWLEAADHCLRFLEAHCRGPGGKLYFSVTREGRPLRMRRYVFSECFAAIGHAAYAKATGQGDHGAKAVGYFETFLRHSFTPGMMPAKTDPATRPMKGLAPLMIAIATAQELRANLGEGTAQEASFTEWIDRAIAEIERDFLKEDDQALLEVVGPKGERIDHFDGRTLNPGHAIECAWFILHEAKLRAHPSYRRLGLKILDWMWQRGWDPEFGGLFYFTDLRGLPVQEYWAHMKFWWPHNEAEIAALLAYRLTGDAKYLELHGRVHDWSRKVFADPVHGEWFGYADRQGRITTRLKGNLWKGPFHLPRMQLYNLGLAAELAAP